MKNTLTNITIISYQSHVKRLLLYLLQCLLCFSFIVSTACEVRREFLEETKPSHKTELLRQEPTTIKIEEKVPTEPVVVEKVTAKTLPTSFGVWQIVNAGSLYSSINKINCLQWPSEEIKKAAGSDAWGAFYPKNGDIGESIATSYHCSDPSTKVHILSIDNHYVPIGEKGLKKLSP